MSARHQLGTLAQARLKELKAEFPNVWLGYCHDENGHKELPTIFLSRGRSYALNGYFGLTFDLAVWSAWADQIAQTSSCSCKEEQ
jgi:hypothetical protein